MIVLDADVLGRQRTGDETYVRELLRALPGVAPDLRFAAVTRDPSLVPAGVEPLALPARSQELRMAWRLPRLLRRVRPELAHFLHVIPPGCPCPAVLTIHDLSFERDPAVMGAWERRVFRTVVPRSARRAARILAISERTRDDLVELYGIAARADRRHPARRRPGLPARRRPRRLPSPRGRDRAAQGPARGRGGGARGRPSARRRRARARPGARARAPRRGRRPARLRAEAGARPPLPGGGLRPLSVALRGVRPAAASRRWPAARRSSRGPTPRCARSPATPRSSRDGDLAEPVRAALADSERLSAAGLERAKRFTWEETARLTSAVYRELLS